MPLVGKIQLAMFIIFSSLPAAVAAFQRVRFVRDLCGLCEGSECASQDTILFCVMQTFTMRPGVIL
jgi:hypothetical protein